MNDAILLALVGVLHDKTLPTDICAGITGNNSIFSKMQYPSLATYSSYLVVLEGKKVLAKLA